MLPFANGVYNRRRIGFIIDTYTRPSLVPLKGIGFPATLGLVGAPAKSFHGIGIGPLLKTLAVKIHCF